MKLPVELVSYIIKNSYTFTNPHLFDDGPTEGEKSTASSIALTSHTFRDILNKNRFRDISFNVGDNDYPEMSDKLKNLVGIFKRGKSVPTLSPLYNYIAKFHFQVIEGVDEVIDVMEDGSLAYILDNLFRSSSLRTSSSSRSLGLHVVIWGPNNEPIRTDWKSINPKLLQSIINVIKFSDVNELAASRISHIPRDLLQRSNVKKLRLDSVSINWEKTNINGSREPLQIESITFRDDQLTIEDINGLLITHLDSDIPGPPTYVLPCLVHLEVAHMCSLIVPVMNKVLECAPSLQSLVLNFYDYCFETEEYGREMAIHYGHLKHLQLIKILHNLDSFPSSVLIHLLEKNIPASVRDLDITFVEGARSGPYPPVAEMIEKLDLDLPTLDKHLVDPSFDCVDNINFSLSLIALEYYNADTVLSSLQTQIPLLQFKRPGIKFKIW